MAITPSPAAIERTALEQRADVENLDGLLQARSALRWEHRKYADR